MMETEKASKGPMETKLILTYRKKNQLLDQLRNW